MGMVLINSLAITLLAVSGVVTTLTIRRMKSEGAEAEKKAEKKYEKAMEEIKRLERIIRYYRPGEITTHCEHEYDRGRWVQLTRIYVDGKEYVFRGLGDNLYNIEELTPGVLTAESEEDTAWGKKILIDLVHGNCTAMR